MFSFKLNASFLCKLLPKPIVFYGQRTIKLQNPWIDLEIPGSTIRRLITGLNYRILPIQSPYPFLFRLVQAILVRHFFDPREAGIPRVYGEGAGRIFHNEVISVFFLLGIVGMVLIEIVADDRQHIWLARGCVLVAVGLLWLAG